MWSGALNPKFDLDSRIVYFLWFSFLKMIFPRLTLISYWLKRFYQFLDSFIQSLCKFDVVLPSLKKMVLHSKMHFGYNSTQKLIQSIESLEYLGPLEMLPKLSKGDIADLVTWVKENNWRTVLHHNTRDEWIGNLNKSFPIVLIKTNLVFILLSCTNAFCSYNFWKKKSKYIK